MIPDNSKPSWPDHCCMASAIWLTEYLKRDATPIRLAVYGAKSEKEAMKKVSRKSTFQDGVLSTLLKCRWAFAPYIDLPWETGIIITDRGFWCDVHYIWKGQTYAWYEDGMKPTEKPKGLVLL